MKTTTTKHKIIKKKKDTIRQLLKNEKKNITYQ